MRVSESGRLGASELVGGHIDSLRSYNHPIAQQLGIPFSTSLQDNVLLSYTRLCTLCPIGNRLYQPTIKFPMVNQSEYSNSATKKK